MLRISRAELSAREASVVRMTYLSAKTLADAAAQSARIAQSQYSDPSQYADRMLADAVVKLAQAVAELAGPHHRASP